jgi:hypothetical protein
MDRNQAQNISSKIMEALKTIEGDLGVTFSRGNGKYDSSSFNMKVTATIDNVDGSTQTPEMIDFQREAHYYGLEASDLGTTFTQNGKTFEIVGLKPRSRKYPILGKDRMGKTFKFTADSVKRGKETVL